MGRHGVIADEFHAVAVRVVRAELLLVAVRTRAFQASEIVGHVALGTAEVAAEAGAVGGDREGFHEPMPAAVVEAVDGRQRLDRDIVRVEDGVWFPVPFAHVVGEVVGCGLRRRHLVPPFVVMLAHSARPR